MAMVLGAAIFLMVAAMAIALHATLTHVRNLPANDHEHPHLGSRFRRSMRAAACLLACSLVVLAIDHFL